MTFTPKVQTQIIMLCRQIKPRPTISLNRPPNDCAMIYEEYTYTLHVELYTIADLQPVAKHRLAI